MELRKTAFGLMAALVLGGASASAFAQHHGGGGFHGGGHGGWHGGGHWHGGGGVGIYFGGPLFWPGYYDPYYGYPYYYPPVVTVPAEPPTYIEQGQNEAPAPDQNSGYWYYCPDSKTYYPYVKECASSWQQVVPQPPPQ
ncbi:MAG TPA: hypothetical protein VMT94_07200 [Burkholderiales bacterium]|nr:hypothetical protein [Burkholderiales bacterium]